MVGKTNVGGGGSAVSTAWAYINAAYPSGSVCTATNGVKTLTAADTGGLYVFHIPQPTSGSESWTVSCTDGTTTRSDTVTISSQYQIEPVELRYSRLPEGYREVEYVETTKGSASSYTHGYITWSSNSPSSTLLQIEFSFMPLSDSNTTSTTGCAFGNYYIGGFASYSGQLGYLYNNSGVGSSSFVIGQKTSVIINQIGTRKIIENGIEIATLSDNSDYYKSIGFGACKQGNGGGSLSTQPMRIYEIKITEFNGNLVVDAVPCVRVSDNVPGFCDLVSTTFFVKESISGPFVAGPYV